MLLQWRVISRKGLSRCTVGWCAFKLSLQTTGVSVGQEEKGRMMQVLTLLNDRCKCEFGNAGALVKRFVTGSAMDYAYEDLKVPYAFQLEIFEGEQGRK